LRRSYDFNADPPIRPGDCPWLLCDFHKFPDLFGFGHCFDLCILHLSEPFLIWLSPFFPRLNPVPPWIPLLLSSLPRLAFFLVFLQWLGFCPLYYRLRLTLPPCVRKLWLALPNFLTPYRLFPRSIRRTPTASFYPTGPSAPRTLVLPVCSSTLPPRQRL